MPTKHQNITPRAAGSRCHCSPGGGSSGWLACGRSPAHQISATLATMATAISPCSMPEALAGRWPSRSMATRVSSWIASRPVLLRSNRASQKPLAMCSAAGRPTGSTARNSSALMPSMRAPKARPIRCGAPPAWGKRLPSWAKVKATGSTRAMRISQAQSEVSPAAVAARAGTTKMPVPSSEVLSRATPCSRPSSLFSRLMGYAHPFSDAAMVGRRPFSGCRLLPTKWRFSPST